MRTSPATTPRGIRGPSDSVRPVSGNAPACFELHASSAARARNRLADWDAAGGYTRLVIALPDEPRQDVSVEKIPKPDLWSHYVRLRTVTDPQARFAEPGRNGHPRAGSHGGRSGLVAEWLWEQP